MSEPTTTQRPKPAQAANELPGFPFEEIDPNAAQQLADEMRTMVKDDLEIASVQIGREQKREGAVILRGRLLRPSHEAFARWYTLLKERGCTPMLHPNPEGSKQDVILRVMVGTVKPPAAKPWINALLFVLTVLSTMFVGMFQSDTLQVNAAIDLIRPSNLIQGWPFSATILSILLAHEFGHYFAARYHKLAVSLPFFIPLPLPGGLAPGTMGAFIRLKELVPDRRKLFDVGVSGPLAGLIVAIPLLFLGLSTVEVKVPPPLEPGQAYTIEGNSLFYLTAKYIMFGKILPNPVTGEDVWLNAVTAAAWFGLLVTALNLLPIGQLDGGHTVFAMFGQRSRILNRVVLVVMVTLAILGIPQLQRLVPFLEYVGYVGWFLWLGLIFFVIGPYHPPALDDVTELDPRRRWIGYLVIVIFILTFVPVPERIVGM